MEENEANSQSKINKNSPFIFIHPRLMRLRRSGKKIHSSLFVPLTRLTLSYQLKTFPSLMDSENDTLQQFKVPRENPQEAKGDVIAEGDDEKLRKILFLIKFLADEKFVSQATRDWTVN